MQINLGIIVFKSLESSLKVASWDKESNPGISRVIVGIRSIQLWNINLHPRKPH